MSDPASISYEKPSGTDGSRSCGAACLRAVYGSLGKDVPQAEIWPVIAKKNRFGVVSSTTYLMAQDALNRGFNAIAFQARHPLQALRLCRDAGARVILNHRTRLDSPSGHYSVLASVEDRDVVLQDPSSGQARRMSHAELLELWQPRSTDSEIVGNVLIVIAAKPAAPALACEFCHASMPPAVNCPVCKKPVPLAPEGSLGCPADSCIARIWNFICCPYCDCAFRFGASTAPSEGVASSDSRPPTAGTQDSPAPPSSLSLDPLFAQMDKFCAYILALPILDSHPEIKKQIDLLQSGKEKLTEARTQALTNLETSRTQLAGLSEVAKRGRESHAKKMEELNAQAPPLDGNALGRALLKSIGFLD